MLKENWNGTDSNNKRRSFTYVDENGIGSIDHSPSNKSGAIKWSGEDVDSRTKLVRNKVDLSGEYPSVGVNYKVGRLGVKPTGVEASSDVNSEVKSVKASRKALSHKEKKAIKTAHKYSLNNKPASLQSDNVTVKKNYSAFGVVHNRLASP